LWYYPFHKLLEPPEGIVRLMFPAVIDVSDDPNQSKVLDVVDALAWVQEEEVWDFCSYADIDDHRVAFPLEMRDTVYAGGGEERSGKCSTADASADATCKGVGTGVLCCKPPMPAFLTALMLHASVTVCNLLDYDPLSINPPSVRWDYKLPGVLMLTVLPGCYCSPWSICMYYLQSHLVLVQALPLLQVRFPHHWIFQQHPLFQFPATDRNREQWAKWCDIAETTYGSAVQHMAVQAECGRTMSDLVIWRPSARLSARVRDMGATWAPVHACLQLLRDPTAQAILSKVRLYPLPAQLQ
jgi:hypothetical protein